jgi:PKD repeat protein
MRRTFALLGALLAVSGTLVFLPSAALAAPPHPAQPLRIAVPLYINPGAPWKEVDAANGSVGFVVANVNNGPGGASNPNYVSAIDAARAVGIEVLGYVYTDWDEGGVSLAKAETWVRDWYSWYGVDGIFFDEAADTCTAADVAYYSALYNYTKAESGTDLVVLNPGTSTGACYGPISDVIVTFEDTFANYTGQYVGSAWTASYPSSHFWNIVYAVPAAADLPTVLSLAAERGAGWVYVTDQTLPNPYGALPSFWDEEANLTLPISSTAVQLSPSSLTLGNTTVISVNAVGNGNALAYEWSGLPGGCVSVNQSSFSCVPTSTGTFDISLNVTDNEGAYTLAVPAILVVDPVAVPPITATFTNSSRYDCSAMIVEFNGTASGGVPPYTWSWSFGGLGIGSGRDPSAVFPAGSFLVELNVTDRVGDIGHAFQNVTNAALPERCQAMNASIYWAFDPSSLACGTVPPTFVADLRASASGLFPPFSFEWSFGDGSANASGQNQTHAYPVYRTFPVVLTVTQWSGGWDRAYTNISWSPTTLDCPSQPPKSSSPASWGLSSPWVLGALALGAIVLSVAVLLFVWRGRRRRGPPREAPRLTSDPAEPPSPEAAGRG